MRLCIEFLHCLSTLLVSSMRWSKLILPNFVLTNHTAKIIHLFTKGKLFVIFPQVEFWKPIWQVFSWPSWKMILPWAKTQQTMLFPNLVPRFFCCQAGKYPINLQGVSKNYGRGGGVRFFRPGPQFFHFGPFWTILDHFLWWMIWTALTLPGSGTSSALGVPEGRPKIQVVCSFLLIFDQFWVLRAKKLRKND